MSGLFRNHGDYIDSVLDLRGARLVNRSRHFTMIMKNKMMWGVLSLAVLSALALAFMSTDQRYVAAPGVTCVVIVMSLYATLLRRDTGKVPLFDVGMFCAATTLVYCVYPLMNYWVGGFSFGIFGDARLEMYKPTPSEMGNFHLRHVLYLFSFSLLYGCFRGKGTLELGNVESPDRPTLHVLVLCFLLLSAFFFVLQLTTGITFHASYETDAFNGKVAAMANAPLLVAQISGKLAGIFFIVKMALLCVVVSRCRDRKWFIVLLLWMGFEIFQAVALKGARGGLMMFLLASLLLYHRIVKSLSVRTLFLLGTTLFSFFMFMGIYRAYSNLSSLHSDYSESDTTIFSGPNEFQAMLGTAYDVHQRKLGGTPIPWYLYLNDVMNVLPPQQMVPFEKVEASEWYLREIGLSGTGQGYMWGVITQSIVGLDWLEVVLRGSFLGFVLARVHRWYLKRQTGFFHTLFYMYLCLNIYNTYRNSTGTIVGQIVWEIIPFWFLLRLGSVVAVCSKRKQPAIAVSQASAS